MADEAKAWKPQNTFGVLFNLQDTLVTRPSLHLIDAVTGSTEKVELPSAPGSERAGGGIRVQFLRIC